MTATPQVDAPVRLRPATTGDLPSMLALLGELGLPVAGVDAWVEHFTVAESAGRLVGLAGLERYPDGGLLRSVAVHPSRRGEGLGRTLVDSVLTSAGQAGVAQVFLLTTTAEAWFPRLGFEVTSRDAVPDSVKQSVEFREACPASAVVMRKSLAKPFVGRGERTMTHLPSDRPWRVLFVCTGNSARSQIAQTVMNRKGAGRFEVASAGSHPAARVHPMAIAALTSHGYAWKGGSPQGIDAVMGQPWDFVITVCDRAKESCPVFPGQPVLAHWGMPDPAEATGTEEERQRAFDDTLRLVSRRLDLLLALPVGKLEKLALQHEVRRIGET